MDNLLIEIGPSHYCEKVRWAMDYIGVEYKEDIHPPIFHLISTKKYKGGSVPLLVTDDGLFKDSTDILKYLDKKSGYGKIYPIDESLKKQVEDLEELFDTKLGPHTRRWAYFYVLDREDIMMDVFVLGIHPLEEAIFQTFFPLIRQMMKASMKINAQSAERSRNKILEVFSKVEELLSDGRKFLIGDHITAADITFVSLAIPILLPTGYSMRREKKVVKVDNDLNREMGIEEEQKALIDIVPSVMADEIRAFRKSKAGSFALEIYKKYRNSF